jgi:hypothetical protein
MVGDGVRFRRFYPYMACKRSTQRQTDVFSSIPCAWRRARGSTVDRWRLAGAAERRCEFRQPRFAHVLSPANYNHRAHDGGADPAFNDPAAVCANDSHWPGTACNKRRIL